MLKNQTPVLSAVFLFILTVDSCTDEEFECQDGNCIPYSSRCDEIFDCADLSDELNCKLDTYS